MSNGHRWIIQNIHLFEYKNNQVNLREFSMKRRLVARNRQLHTYLHTYSTYISMWKLAAISCQRNLFYHTSDMHMYVYMYVYMQVHKCAFAKVSFLLVKRKSLRGSGFRQLCKLLAVHLRLYMYLCTHVHASIYIYIYIYLYENAILFRWPLYVCRSL